MIFLFHNFVTQELNDADNAILFYLVEVKQSEKSSEQSKTKLYKLAALPKEAIEFLDNLRGDPLTVATTFWPIRDDDVAKIAGDNNIRHEVFRLVDSSDLSLLPEAYHFYSDYTRR